ncbi:type I-C CRISPR-associated protein Cas7/Csd2 [Kurthia senegalensis]|uniref:type I-C CRISPR-associated protein Cas7/Csd2 n=1 Tax=Kurthia senegalensis TaxID=1033740 RepID=UPI0002889F4F|nr:type I-C CRISPR-associated protein Cas7/Csd2 [Kurthia senegalensis]
MTFLTKKIDFAVIFTVNQANPNGDPLNGNRPRQNFEGYGEVSDVAIKRKIRNRAMDLQQPIFVQPKDKNVDGFKSLRERANAVEQLVEAEKEKDDVLFAKVACATWFDVRAFGQLFAFRGGTQKGTGVSVGIRGPVSIHPAFSVEPIHIISTHITKSTNSETSERKGADTMGMKHRVERGVYRFFGSINPQLAEKTGFTPDDAEQFKVLLQSLFENDASSARPDGSMEVQKVLWWEHPTKLGTYSSAKVHRSLQLKEASNRDEPFELVVEPLEGIQLSIYEGM